VVTETTKKRTRRKDKKKRTEKEREGKRLHAVFLYPMVAA